MAKYLSLPVRIGVLIIVAAAIGLALMPPDLRNALTIKAALVVGYFLPALAISVAVWWLTFSKTWLLRALMASVALTAVVIAAEPAIHEHSEKQRIYNEASVTGNGPEAVKNVTDDKLGLFVTSFELVKRPDICLLHYYSEYKRLCYFRYKDALEPYTPNRWDRGLISRLRD
jgi:multisubunit Na+/H+ antiporter MnhG subunit